MIDHSALIARRRSLCWRIHFWAALIATPFALLAAFTGIFYIFTPQIEESMYGSLERVTPSGSLRPLDAAVAAAIASAPTGAAVRSVLPAYAARDSVQVSFAISSPSLLDPEHAAHRHHSAGEVVPQSATARTGDTVVYVNPYTDEVLGQVPDQERFNTWAKKLHSSLLQGDGWRWMIELAASWLLVMLLTGTYLWWPRGSQKALPQAHVKGRSGWKQWHSFMGIALSVISFAMLATGVTWSKYAGARVREIRDFVGQAPPSAPRNLISEPKQDVALLSWQRASEIARTRAPNVRMQLVPPRGAQDIWRISNADRSRPMQKFDLVLDAYSGQVLYYADWHEQTAFAKATAVGIPFHRGELGVWNQVLLLLFGSGVLFSILSGWIMFFKRRTSARSILPPVLPGALRSVPIAAWIVAAGLVALLPLLFVSALAVMVVEIWLRWSGPREDSSTANTSA